MTKKAGRNPGEVAAAEFKTRCLELMDRVRETGAEYVITKHGVPVARLVPVVEARRTRFFGSMQGTVLEYERPVLIKKRSHYGPPEVPREAGADSKKAGAAKEGR